MSHSTSPRRRFAVSCVCAALVTGVAAGQTSGPGAAAPPPPTTTRPTAAPPPTSAPATSAPAKDLAPAATLVEQGLDALGGRAAIDGIKTLQYELVAQIAGGPATFKLRNGRNGRFLADGQSTGGNIMMGRHGDVAWRKMPDGRFALMPPERVGPDILGYLFILTDPKTKTKTVDRTTFAEVDCWKVEVTDPDGEAAFAYFDVDGGLLRGMDKVRQVRDEERITRTTFRAYEKIAPLNLFTEATMIQVGGAALADFKFSNISFNTVPESDFEIPAGVVALLEAEKTKPQVAASQPDKGDATAKVNPQMQRLIDRLQEMNDLAQLEMLAGFLEGRLDHKDTSEDDRASMQVVVEKIRGRIAELKAGQPEITEPGKTEPGKTEPGKTGGAAGSGG